MFVLAMGEEMYNGENLAITAMEKELDRLTKIADKEKAELDEFLNITDEMLAIQEEFKELINAKEHGTPETIKKAKDLKDRAHRADKIVKKDIIKLMDKHQLAADARDDLKREIQEYKFRKKIKRDCAR